MVPLEMLLLLLLLLLLLRRQGRQMSACTHYYRLCAPLGSFWWVAYCTTHALFRSNRAAVPDAVSPGISGHTPVFKVSQRPGMCLYTLALRFCPHEANETNLLMRSPAGGGSAKIYALFGVEEPQAAAAAPSPVSRPSKPSQSTAPAGAAQQTEPATTTPGERPT